jgi:ankyrin repeat protein
MIYELLRDGFVNASVDLNKSTSLHWACEGGYLDIVLLLLNYENVDVCAKDNLDSEPIFYAAQNGHTESYSI